MKDDSLYLDHILECIGRIEEWTRGGKETFLSSTVLQDAVLRNLQVMAESAGRLSEPRKARYPEIDWGGIAAFRNVLVHDYLGTDLDEVWDIISIDLPSLKAAVESMQSDPGS